MSRRNRWTIATIVVIAAVVRIPGLFTDFWGDEIWSWSIAGQLHSVSDVLLATPARIDNNHPLNTLWLYLCGPHAAVWLYRMPALLAGIGTVVVAVHVMSRRSVAAAITAAVVIGFSFPLIFYSSEARGYSLAVFFGFVTFDALESYLATGGALAELMFGLTASLGFWSHLTFLHVYAGAFVWSAVVILRGEDAKTRRREGSHEEQKTGPTQASNTFSVFASSFAASRLRVLSRLHALPLLTAFLLSSVFVKHMTIGGAPATDIHQTLLWTISLPIGGPYGGIGSVVVASTAVVLLILSLLLISWPRRQWIFFAVAVAVSPALTTTREIGFAEHPQPLFVRYFLVCIAFGLLATCPLIARGCQNKITRTAILVTGVLFLLGNGIHLTSFARLGRGGVSKAVARLADSSRADPIEVASDNTHRTEALANFFASRLQPARVITVRKEPLQWLVLNRSDSSTSSHIVFEQFSYTLDTAYPSDRLSGWTWLLYRRDSR